MIDHKAIHDCFSVSAARCLCHTCKHDKRKCCYEHREYKHSLFDGKACSGGCPDYEPEEKE